MDLGELENSWDRRLDLTKGALALPPFPEEGEKDGGLEVSLEELLLNRRGIAQREATIEGRRERRGFFAPSETSGMLVGEVARVCVYVGFQRVEVVEAGTTEGNVSRERGKPLRSSQSSVLDCFEFLIRSTTPEEKGDLLVINCG